MKRKVIAIIVPVLLAAGAAAYFKIGPGQRAAEAGRLFVSGSIEARELQLAFNQPGIVAEVAVDDGDQVKAGQMVMRLDTDRLQRQLAEAEAAVATAAARLDTMPLAIRKAEETTQAGVVDAMARLSQALAAQEAARAAWERAKVELDRADKEWRRVDPLFRSGATAAKSRDDARAAMDAARTSVSQSLAQHLQAQAAVRQAQADEALARGNALEPERLEKERVVVQAQLVQAQAAVETLRQTIKEATVAAPVTGRVLSRNINPGEVVSAGTSVLTVADLEHLWMRAYIPEASLGQVKLGQKVAVEVDAFPGRPFVGRVTFISDKAEFTPKTVQTKDERTKLVFRIKASLDNPDQQLKPGMPADGWIALK